MNIKPQIAISSPAYDKYLKSRHMIHYVRKLYPEDHREIFGRILGLKRRSVNTGRLSDEEYRRLLQYYLSDHEEALDRAWSGASQPMNH